jgi:hypothetical protein
MAAEDVLAWYVSATQPNEALSKAIASCFSAPQLTNQPFVPLIEPEKAPNHLAPSDEPLLTAAL